MKILNLSFLYYPSIGGNQIHMKELSGKLVELGEQVTVFTSNAISGRYMHQPCPEGKSLALSENIDGVRIRRFPISYNLNKLLYIAITRLHGGHRLCKIIFGRWLEVLQRGPLTPGMAWEIYKFKPDIAVVLNAYHAHNLYCYLARSFAKFPLVLIPALHMGNDWVENPLTLQFLKRADLIISITDFEKEFLVARGVNQEKISVIGVGIHHDKFTESTGTSFRAKHNLGNNPVVTYVGRRVREKGIETLIDAMRIVWKKNPQARLVLAGARDSKNTSFERGKLRSLSDKERGKVILVDNFSQKEKPDIFAACDVFVLPSKLESFGIVYLEAWACGKPVIGCKKCPPSTLIDDGTDGLLVEHGNACDLASALIKLLNNPRMRRDMGNAGREKVLKEYTWDTIGKKMQTELYKLVNKKGNG